MIVVCLQKARRTIEATKSARSSQNDNLIGSSLKRPKDATLASTNLAKKVKIVPTNASLHQNPGGRVAPNTKIQNNRYKAMYTKNSHFPSHSKNRPAMSMFLSLKLRLWELYQKSTFNPNFYSIGFQGFLLSQKYRFESYIEFGTGRKTLTNARFSK